MMWHSIQGMFRPGKGNELCWFGEPHQFYVFVAGAGSTTYHQRRGIDEMEERSSSIQITFQFQACHIFLHSFGSNSASYLLNQLCDMPCTRGCSSSRQFHRSFFSDQESGMSTTSPFSKVIIASLIVGWKE
jgi:hypothetical protein